MFYLGPNERIFVTWLYLTIGILDTIFVFASCWIMYKHSTESMKVYRWVMLNSVDSTQEIQITGYISDVTASIFAPIFIDQYAGYYSASFIQFAPFLQHLIACIYMIFVHYNYVAISLTYYFRLRINLNYETTRLSNKAVSIAYPFLYMTGPVTLWAMTMLYFEDINGTTNSYVLKKH
ncbi:unnamed protein product, partial [Mesorhabditis belari]|uniref:Uncharacterized protein n=1 Tax=Mesorhabditis belari TaxID=2138241 RepID=A0AAF3EWR0_9BILA